MKSWPVRRIPKEMVTSTCTTGSSSTRVQGTSMSTSTSTWAIHEDILKMDVYRILLDCYRASIHSLYTRVDFYSTMPSSTYVVVRASDTY
jgi:hypothetical protein